MIEEEENIQGAILEISQHELDKEALGQASLYRYWARKLANAEYQVSIKKAKLEVLEAELAAKIRINPKKYIKGDFARGSPSETALKAAVIQIPEYQKAKTRYHKAEHLVSQLKADVRACEHRREALSNLITLWGKAYWADPWSSAEVPRSDWSRLQEEETKRKVKKFNETRKKEDRK